MPPVELVLLWALSDPVKVAVLSVAIAPEVLVLVWLLLLPVKTCAWLMLPALDAFACEASAPVKTCVWLIAPVELVLD